jgi:nitrogen fixation/metabolism regulation signal transduction histidine kinase
MQEEPFAIDALIGEVLELYQAGKVRIDAALGVPEAKVRGDAKRLRQVIHNLLKNAIEALDAGHAGHIRVSTQYAFSDETPAIEMTIEDNGGGIDPTLIDRLFEPYVTSKAKGTGLGLAIVKKIIEEHGGIIVAENTTDGALVRIRLPVWQSGSPTETGAAPEEQQRHPTP